MRVLSAIVVVAFLLTACGTADNGRVNVTLTDNKIVLDRASVQHGNVTFVVKNTGTVVHELVVLKTDIAADKIPADPDEQGKVEEEGSQGESGDLDKGEAKEFTLNLTSGRYALICNQVGHYAAGMHIAFEVK